MLFLGLMFQSRFFRTTLLLLLMLKKQKKQKKNWMNWWGIENLWRRQSWTWSRPSPMTTAWPTPCSQTMWSWPSKYKQIDSTLFPCLVRWWSVKVRRQNKQTQEYPPPGLCCSHNFLSAFPKGLTVTTLLLISFMTNASMWARMTTLSECWTALSIFARGTLTSMTSQMQFRFNYKMSFIIYFLSDHVIFRLVARTLPCMEFIKY